MTIAEKIRNWEQKRSIITMLEQFYRTTAGSALIAQKVHYVQWCYRPHSIVAAQWPQKTVLYLLNIVNLNFVELIHFRNIEAARFKLFKGHNFKTSNKCP